MPLTLEEPRVNKTLLNILLVEDEEADVKITQEAFIQARLKNRLNAAKDGIQALDYLYHRGIYRDAVRYPKPDLILLDINMPEIGGFEFLKQIRSDAQFDSVAILMLSSSINSQDIALSREYGATNYLRKPVRFEDFLDIINGFMFSWMLRDKIPEIFEYE